MTKEIWKDIEDYEGLYQVSNLGRVKSLERKVLRKDGRYKVCCERILSPRSNGCGYVQVRLFKGSKSKYFSIHRLVSQAFIPNPENKSTVNHIDGNKLNNHAKNLEWCTQKENIRHAFATELSHSKKGQFSPKAKLTNEQAKSIREEYIPYSRKHGLSALARKYDVIRSTIWLIVKNKTYKTE